MSRFDRFADTIQEDGFVLVPDVVPTEDLEAVFSTVEALMSARGHDVVAGSRGPDGFVHRGMILAIDQAPQDAAFTYNAIDFSPAFMRLMTGPSIVEAARCLTRTDRTDQVLLNNMNTRIDLPCTDSQMIGWHQDYPYIHTDCEPQFSITAWIPLETCGPEHGVLEVARGSHRAGILPTRTVPKEHGNRDDHLICDEALAPYEHSQIEVPRGSALFMHINTAHRSGHNTSDKVRYTAIGRYHNAATMDVLVEYHRPARPMMLQPVAT